MGHKNFVDHTDNMLYIKITGDALKIVEKFGQDIISDKIK